MTDKPPTDDEIRRVMSMAGNARGKKDGDAICRMWAAIVSVYTSPREMDEAIDAAIDAEESP